MSILDNYLDSKNMGKVVTNLRDILLKNKNKLGFLDANRIIHDLKHQIYFFKKHGWGILAVSIDSIELRENGFITTDECMFFRIREESLYLNRVPNESSKSFYFAPELNTIETIPASVPFQCIYYSIAKLIVRCVLNTEDVLEIKKLKHLPLYHFLIRCIEKDPLERNYINI
jgi:hypothetical protein